MTTIDRLHDLLIRQLDVLRPLDERCAVITTLSQLADGTSSDNERRMTLSTYVLAGVGRDGIQLLAEDCDRVGW